MDPFYLAVSYPPRDKGTRDSKKIYAGEESREVEVIFESSAVTFCRPINPPSAPPQTRLWLTLFSYDRTRERSLSLPVAVKECVDVKLMKTKICNQKSLQTDLDPITLCLQGKRAAVSGGRDNPPQSAAPSPSFLQGALGLVSNQHFNLASWHFQFTIRLVSFVSSHRFTSILRSPGSSLMSAMTHPIYSTVT